MTTGALRAAGVTVSGDGKLQCCGQRPGGLHGTATGPQRAKETPDAAGRGARRGGGTRNPRRRGKAHGKETASGLPEGGACVAPAVQVCAPGRGGSARGRHSASAKGTPR